MIPLYAKNKTRNKSFGFINILLIIACIAVFIYEVRLPKALLEQFFYDYGIIPDWVLKKTRPVDMWTVLYPYTTYIFIHGGWLHLAGNMLFLTIFGFDVEKQLGRAKYFTFFILCGIISGIIHTVMNINCPTPTIGASGAIAGVLGAYFIFFPKAKIKTIIPLIVITPIIEVPAVIFLGFWFVFQFLSAGAQAQESVAWWAHIGGFAAGIFFALVIFKKK